MWWKKSIHFFTLKSTILKEKKNKHQCELNAQFHVQSKSLIFLLCLFFFSSSEMSKRELKWCKQPIPSDLITTYFFFCKQQSKFDHIYLSINGKPKKKNLLPFLLKIKLCKWSKNRIVSWSSHIFNWILFLSQFIFNFMIIVWLWVFFLIHSFYSSNSNVCIWCQLTIWIKFFPNIWPIIEMVA